MARLRHDKSPEALRVPPAKADGTPDGRSRPARIDDPGIRQQIVGAIGAGATIEAAARFVGVAPSMIYDRKAKDPDFGLQCDDARVNEVARLAMTLIVCARRAGTDKAQPGDMTALIFALKNFDPVHFRDRKEIEVSIPDIPGRLREAAERARARLLSVAKAEAVTCEIVPFVAGGYGGNGHG